MRYRGAQDAPVFGLVGKGITCDTGGYCVKGKDSLPYIKGDMAGAATVMAIVLVMGTKRPESQFDGGHSHSGKRD